MVSPEMETGRRSVCSSVTWQQGVRQESLWNWETEFFSGGRVDLRVPALLFF